MTEEEADIARIAAMRGHPVNYYTELQRSQVSAIPDNVLGNVFRGNEDWYRDIRAYDRLPPRSRAFLSACPLMLSAVWFDSLLGMFHGDEEALISRLLDHVPGRLQDFLRRHYGAGHPNLRRV